jgi:hypothetical protein
MSRKDFIVLAAALRIQREQALINLTTQNRIALVDELIYTIATVCKSQNKLFSFDRFYRAANYKGGIDLGKS